MNERVKEILQERGIKHKWLYEQVGVTKSQFSYWINGKRNLTTDQVERIKQILKLLGVDV